MDVTMAATPKALSAPVFAPQQATWRSHTAAFPAQVAQAAQAHGSYPTGTTVRTRTSDSGLPEAFWAILPAVWFFVAGVTLGVFLAVALFASGPTARTASARVAAPVVALK